MKLLSIKILKEYADGDVHTLEMWDYGEDQGSDRFVEDQSVMSKEEAKKLAEDNGVEL